MLLKYSAERSRQLFLSSPPRPPSYSPRRKSIIGRPVTRHRAPKSSRTTRIPGARQTLRRRHSTVRSDAAAARPGDENFSSTRGPRGGRLQNIRARAAREKRLRAKRRRKMARRPRPETAADAAAAPRATVCLYGRISRAEAVPPPPRSNLYFQPIPSTAGARVHVCVRALTSTTKKAGVENFREAAHYTRLRAAAATRAAGRFFPRDNPFSRPPSVFPRLIDFSSGAAAIDDEGTAAAQNVRPARANAASARVARKGCPAARVEAKKRKFCLDAYANSGEGSGGGGGVEGNENRAVATRRKQRDERGGVGGSSREWGGAGATSEPESTRQRENAKQHYEIPVRSRRYPFPSGPRPRLYDEYFRRRRTRISQMPNKNCFTESRVRAICICINPSSPSKAYESLLEFCSFLLEGEEDLFHL